VDVYLQQPCTDHFPIVTVLDLPHDRVEVPLTWNYRMANWGSFMEGLKVNLEAVPLPKDLKTEEDI
jgi:hypothetical protein